MTRTRIATAALALAIAAAAFTSIRAAEPAKKEEMPCCPIDPKAAAALDRMKSLSGTWTTKPSAPAEPPMSIVFRPTSAGTAVIETMFPGSDHEMVNLYTADGESILLTHYCAIGSQPRMKLAPGGDAKAMKFEFVDGGNIKSRNEAHMDSVVLTVDGDKLTEDWAYFQDGKVTDHKIFEFHRQPKEQGPIVMANPLKLLKLKPTGFQFIQEVPINAPPARVWAALLNMRVWFRFDQPDWPEVSLEPHVGGRMMAQSKDGSVSMLQGIVGHMERGKLLRINGHMGMTHLPVMTAMIWELQPRNGGKATRLRFCQRTFGYITSDLSKSFQGGWKKLFPQLKALAEKSKRGK